MKPLLRSISILKSLHWVTWVVMGMFALALMLIVVPGDLYYRSSLDRSQSWWDVCRGLQENTVATPPISTSAINRPLTYIVVYEHGWPFPYLARAIVEQDSGTPPIATWHEHISWCHQVNWPFGAEASVFRWWAFLLDLLLATTIVATAGGLTEWRIRSRRGFFRFGLLDLFVGVAFLSFPLGYYAYHSRLHEFEEQAHQPPAENNLAPVGLYDSSRDGSFSTRHGYTGPAWLEKLCGGTDHLQFLEHRYFANIWADESWRQTFDTLERFPYLSTIGFQDPMPLGAAERLARFPRLKRLILPVMQPDSAPTIKGTDEPVFGPEHLAQLRNLRINWLVLRGSAIQAKHVAAAAALPEVRRILLLSTAVTTEDLHTLQQRFPQVEIEITEYY
ncbi:hypothetical protein [Blastopirellula marina]|uniref:Uncharacterized protein n=1 Tax=Blastopirellula marina TaxID=124 RepID=A0A2S8FLC4_9BACT|nr:hypothetical protein [Blastopirellula marina]PQO32963.1 hypothetical protein C5Y98_17650 [Blastopirellula marina]PTL43130.1 hypothetical protein C5Y97_17660 [Blastopirellula marina]